MGLSGPIPARVDAATKAALVSLVDQANVAGWAITAACNYLELPKRRFERWRHRAATGTLVDSVPGGNPEHQITPAEESEIMAVFETCPDRIRTHKSYFCSAVKNRFARRGFDINRSFRQDRHPLKMMSET